MIKTGKDRAETGRDSRDPSRPTLHFLTCGSAEGGKSTLVVRLLQDCCLMLDADRHDMVNEIADFTLRTDRREAEMTMDAVYRYFGTQRRSFIAADYSRHVQYVRGVTMGAARADLAIIVIDARRGLTTQTRRDATIVSLLGVRHIVLAVNKMDLVGYDRSIFDEIIAAFTQFGASLRFSSITAIPISARFGGNVSFPSINMPWHKGPNLLACLETIDAENFIADQPMRFPVQWVSGLGLDFHCFSGTIASGRIRAGDEIVEAATSRRARIARIVATDGDAPSATAPESVTVVLADKIDVSRGDVFCHPNHRPSVADQFAAYLIWMSEDELLPGRSYLIEINNRTIPATVTEIKHRLDMDTQAKSAAKTLALSEIGFCNFAVTAPVAIDAFETNRITGAFILIDRVSNATVAAGMIAFPLRRATNITLQALTVDKAARSRIKHQKPAILWFTGLSGTGKSTVANLVDAKLLERRAHTILLDGDNVRLGLNKDLGFTDADRVENIRRIGEVAKLMVDAGLIALCSFISPFEAERRFVRQLVEKGEFIEIFLDAPLDVCIARDPKGLYERALKGEIKNFTGIDRPYQRPEHPELRFFPSEQSAEEIAQQILEYLHARMTFPASWDS